MKIMGRRFIAIILVMSLFYFEGCAALKKKFTRKPKKKERRIEEVVLTPEEYSVPVYSLDVQYKNHYTLWMAWHDELILNLKEGASRKRQIDCFDETLLNLERMKFLLTAEKQGEIQIYIDSIADFKENLIEKSPSMINFTRLKDKMSSIRKKIKLNFSYKNAKESLNREKNDI